MSLKKVNMILIIIVALFIIIAGIAFLAHYFDNKTNLKNMIITSPSFNNLDYIPAKYTCDGEDINPALQFGGVPETAKSLVLIVDDPDAPMGTWVHWIVWNIDPGIGQINENSASLNATQGKTGSGKAEYGGPCPPSGVHHYYFKLYALDTTLALGSDADKAALESAMVGHILAKAELVGLYNRGR